MKSEVLPARLRRRWTRWLLVVLLTMNGLAILLRNRYSRRN